MPNPDVIPSDAYCLKCGGSDPGPVVKKKVRKKK